MKTLQEFREKRKNGKLSKEEVNEYMILMIGYIIDKLEDMEKTSANREQETNSSENGETSSD